MRRQAAHGEFGRMVQGDWNLCFVDHALAIGGFDHQEGIADIGGDADLELRKRLIDVMQITRQGHDIQVCAVDGLGSLRVGKRDA